MQLTQEQYNLRIRAIDDLNEHEHTVSFALCSFKDVHMVSRAHAACGWEGGDYVVVVDKVNKMEKTKQAYGLIEHCQPAVVSFKGPQGESCWNFTDDPDERKQRWPVVAQKTKLKDEAGNLINFSEQPWRSTSEPSPIGLGWGIGCSSTASALVLRSSRL